MINFKFTSIFSFILFTLISNAYAIENKKFAVVVTKETKHDRATLPLSFTQYKNIDIEKKILDELVPLPLKLSGFQGLGAGIENYQIKLDHPDPSGSVGFHQYVQWVNTDIAVFDKQTGKIAAGFPMPGNSLWRGFGGACETANTGQGSVKFDHLANRWVLGQVANTTQGVFYQCVAISETEDATGNYLRYAFQLSGSPQMRSKLSLWSDGYYVSYVFSNGKNIGPNACALDRNNMLAGNAATMQCVSLAPTFNLPVVPADLDGKQSPPAGNPEYFVGLDEPINILIYKFHVDFTTPANTTLTPFSLPVKSFRPACENSNGNNCIIQPTTNNFLNITSNAIEGRISYRQFTPYGSMVMSHNVEGPLPKLAPAIRWYELRVYPTANFNPVVYQQATIAPDTKNRFNGAIAIDRFTNIAIGYSMTSSLIYPSIELGFHGYADQLNKMFLQAGVTGFGAQTMSSTYGGTGNMALDPNDECTFWYTGEYLKTTGSMNWHTFILKFKFPNC